MNEKVVLVIEDDELNQKLVKEILRVGNYKAIEALDAETGIEMARRHKPDLILMDIHLPKMDGFSATKIIKSDKNLKQLPIVALTALAMPDDREKALEAGCDGYVTKPFRFQDLLKTIDQLLDSSDRVNIMENMKDSQET
ncbi:MAG: response regulator [Thermodesulfobacteriota bacterium]|nr:response regulator [Thermodesulfobacteriota bacterium]